MEEQLVSFETAKLAKEKGFDVETISLWVYTHAITPKLTRNCGRKLNHNKFQQFFSAPTQSLLQKWLREKHDLIVYVIPTYEPDNIYRIFKCNAQDSYIQEFGSTYEQALEKGLYEALKLI